MTVAPNSWDIGGDAGNSFPFDNIGAQVSGTVEALQEVQQTDITTGEPSFWPGGQPKMMYRVTLRTSLRDPVNPMDDGRRDIYLKGSRKAESQSSLAAVLDAVKRATGTTEMQYGATLSVAYIGDGQAEKGKNAPKLYAAQYVRPAMGLGGQAAQQYTPAPPQQYQFPTQAAPAAPPQWPTQPAAPQPPAHVPAPARPSAPGTPAAGQPTPEQLAAVRAAGLDPATVFPGFVS